MTDLIEPVLDNDHLDYYPLQDGTLPVSSTKTTRFLNLKDERGNIFQGGDWDVHLKNKILCRSEGRIHKYYQNRMKLEESKYLASILMKLSYSLVQLKHSGHGDYLIANYSLHNTITNERFRFDSQHGLLESDKFYYVDEIDAIISQCAEDIIVLQQQKDGTNKVVLAHLMSPAEWSAEWAIDKSFAEIHENVKRSDGRVLMPNTEAIVAGMIKAPEPLQRVGAISFRTFRQLNLHPDTPKPEEVWDWNDPNLKPLLRFERQVIFPLPQINAFMLTVRGYYDNLSSPKRIEAAIKALQNPSPEVNRKKFIAEHGENLRLFLEKKLLP